MRARFGEFTLDTAARQLLDDGRPVRLSRKPFEVLRVLVERRPDAVSKHDLLTLVWPGTFTVEASLTNVITELRRLLRDDRDEPRFIRTVHGFGYAFCGPVEAAGEPAAAGSPASGHQPGHPAAWLVWNERRLMLREGDNLVGRDPTSDVWIDMDGVSRRHARIRLTGGSATLEDLGSTNGTTVGSATVTGVTPLVDGNIVHLGPVAVQFRTWAQRQAVATERIKRGT